MKKYGIVVDSSVAFTQEQAKQFNVVVVPLTLTHNGTPFEDQIGLTFDDVKTILSKNEIIMTSQPNIGTIIQKMEAMAPCDHIFVLSLSSNLSGTHQAFNHAIQELKLNNATLIDTHSLGGPVQVMVERIRQLESEDADVPTILAALAEVIDHTCTYVYPQDFKQLKASGRISPAAATLASLLRIKPVLRFENKGEKIEKFATARTEGKAFEIITDDLKAKGVNVKDHVISILEFEAEAVTERFLDHLAKTFPGIQIKRFPLPAAVATHAGIGTIAIQWCPKS